ncbi:TRAP transporter small permease [Desulfocicer niacini]
MLTKISKTATGIMIAICSTVLAMMMFLTALDVGLRYLFNRPLAGAFELVEYMMAIIVPFSIVYCAYEKAHVSVELILERFPLGVQRFFDLFTTAVSIIFVSLIAWQNFLYIGECYVSEMTSAVLLIPAYPFAVPLAIGILTFALILLLHLSQALSEDLKK